MTRLPEELRPARLHLSCWRPEDAPELRALLDHNDAHLRPWIPFMRDEPRPLAKTRDKLVEAREAFARGEHFRFAVRRATDGPIVGEAMLIGRGGPDTLEAGYWLDASCTGRGYATEATAALLPFAFERVDVARVLVRCDVRNAASLRVAARLGGVPIDHETLEENGETVTLRVFLVSPPR